ncbi:MAG TPA: uracil-DNA glycosylase [Candidatus Eisenbacteria bacterium]|nr:uracil-DNA glycosylase [Candidatus Eisenbacteria bacterium]
MSREDTKLVVRYLEREIAVGRGSLWEATISASRRVDKAPALASAPQAVAPARTSVIDLEAESLLSDAPPARPGPGDPLPGDDLQKIAAEVRSCTQCGLSKCRTQAVPGVGTGSSGIVFVGEAPGAEEDRRGEPFVGRAGELLTKILAAMDERKLIPGVAVSRESVYICNVLKCRPPENRNPLPHEIEACSPYLLRQLAILRPKIICCLGKFAAELLVGAKGTVASMRGKVYRFGSAKLLVTYHPAACLRNPGLKRPVWEDMQRLAEEYASL